MMPQVTRPRRTDARPAAARPRFAVLPMAAVLIAGLALATPRASATPAPTDTAASTLAHWNVSRPPGPHHDAAIDVTEGTWMSVDVSPDGKTVVFDLLGDLYTMPNTGGEATAITQGVAWDEQPRFSPDGKRIAFTSDRAGGDNIWIVDRDGGHPTQVTKETFRLLNSPSWSPDGDFIVARKHFTSTRSAGAGEMWLYHRTGGSGVPMTKKTSEQKDTGEPVFSPDGRYLYYSYDATPGEAFNYNKDPNPGIYAINRLDRVSGETEGLTGGAGGACRPTPSPDGKWLAFVRRVRYQSTLFVRDLASGAERPVWSGLDRDMQETWAIHGVYPSMAWTPDGASIVLWAGGHLQQVKVATGEAHVIPFHVKTTRQLTDAVRFRQSVAPESFHTRMLRWVQVSPQGERVVYQTLGHLYVRDLPNGTPRRLTAQNDHAEFYPAWSRDGRWIVYVTWDDSLLGSVRVAPAAGGAGRTLTTQPGHYVEPAFSPDGRTVVYRKSSDGYLRSPLWSSQPGIYAVRVGGGAPKRISREGAQPQFGAASDRVYLFNVAGADEDDRTLFSITLDGTDKHVFLHGGYLTELAVSPDERWVAFTQDWNAYLAPLVRAGQTVEIGKDMQSLPIRRVARDAGANLSWSGDSRTLHWSLGPKLYTRPVAQCFTFVPGAPDSLPPPTAQGLDVGFEVRSDVPSGALALTGARLITMQGDQVIEDGVLVVRGNRITGIGARGNVAVPADAKVVDVRGATIMPGIVDVHWHGGMTGEEIQPGESWLLDASLAFGVTTLHDPSNDTQGVFSSSELQRAGMLHGPRIFSTGTILYGAKGDVHAEIDSLGDALFHLRRMQAVGAFSVKSYNQPRRDQRQQVIAAARELHMMVVPEGGSLLPHNLTMVVDGHTGVEHSLPVARIYQDITQLWSASAVGYTPTLGVAYGGIMGENYWYAKTHVWEDERLLRFVPRRIIDARSRRPFTAPDEEWNHLSAAANAKRLLDAGVSVQLGAHGQREGLAAHWEMWMLAQGGMTPMQALRCATLNGARYLGLDGDLGSLAPGKLADLIVLDRNPLENIRDTESIRYVMQNGRLYDGRRLDEIGNHPRRRHSFYFEHAGAQGGLTTSGTDDDD